MTARPEPEATATSASWAGEPEPAATVAVATFDRASFLPELLAALEVQTLPRERFEVIVVDDASTDDTWKLLTGLAHSTPLRLLAVRMAANGGPALARNAASRLARGEAIAFTDDDCLPASGWLGALTDAFDDGIDVVQGRTLPTPTPNGSGPWDRSVWITRPSHLFETCNIAYRRTAFEAQHGFRADRPSVRGTRPHFGEDAELGWRVAGDGRRAAYAPGALVHHRVHPGSWRDWLLEQRRLSLFPSLVRRSPGLGRALVGGLFLSRRTASFDAALVSLAAAATGRPWALAGTIPWILDRWREARRRPGRSVAVRLAQLAAGDAVALASLVEGSVRARRPVL